MSKICRRPTSDVDQDARHLVQVDLVNAEDPRRDEAVRLLLLGRELAEDVADRAFVDTEFTRDVHEGRHEALSGDVFLQTSAHHAPFMQRRDAFRPSLLTGEAAKPWPLGHDRRHPTGEGHVLEVSDVVSVPVHGRVFRRAVRTVPLRSERAGVDECLARTTRAVDLRRDEAFQLQHVFLGSCSYVHGARPIVDRDHLFRSYFTESQHRNPNRGFGELTLSPKILR